MDGSGHQAVAAFFAVLAALSVLFDDFLSVFDVDACARARARLPDGERPPTLLGPWEFTASVAALVFALAALCLYSLGRRRVLAYRLLVSVSVYAGVSSCLELAKHLLVADTSCSSKPNGISGHTSLFVFYACLTLDVGCAALFSNDDDDSDNARWPHTLGLLARVVIPLFWLLAFVTLSSTWRGGYHSLRQMVYGGLWGALAYWLVAALLRSDVRPTKLLSLLAFFLAASGAAFASLLPDVHPPVSSTGWIVTSVVWLLASVVKPAEPDELLIRKQPIVAKQKTT